MKSLFLGVTIATLATGQAVSANTLIGDEVDIFGSVGSSVENILISDTEVELSTSLPLGPNLLRESIDIFADGFTFNFFKSGPDNVFTTGGEQLQILGLDLTNDPLNSVIKDVRLVSADPIDLIGEINFADSLGLDSGMITVNLNNSINLQNGDNLYTFKVDWQTTSVPESSSAITLLLLGLGLITRFNTLTCSTSQKNSDTQNYK